MGWLMDVIQRFLGSIGIGKAEPPDPRLQELLSTKETLAARTQKLTDRKDILNEHFKTIMSIKDTFALEDLKGQFRLLSEEVMSVRQSVNQFMAELKQYQTNVSQESLTEAVDEFEEMLKALNIIIKHEKAIQHAEIPQEPAPAEPVSMPSDAGEKDVQDMDTRPGIRQTGKTALENMQNQQTVFINITKDMLQPPPGYKEKEAEKNDLSNNDPS